MQPHHDPSARYVDQPNPSLGDTVEVSVELGALSGGIGDSWLRFMSDGEQAWEPGIVDSDSAGGQWLRFRLPCDQRAVNYRFHLETPDGPRWLTGLGLIDWDPGDVHDFRLLTTGGPPPWISDDVWYQIFPDRFARAATAPTNVHLGAAARLTPVVGGGPVDVVDGHAVLPGDGPDLTVWEVEPA